MNFLQVQVESRYQLYIDTIFNCLLANPQKPFILLICFFSCPIFGIDVFMVKTIEVKVVLYSAKI